MIPSVADLESRRLTLAPEFRDQNPRQPHTHGWLALEVLRRAPGGTMPFAEYARQLFDPEDDIRTLARTIPGQVNAYQHLKHIRCDIYRRWVTVSPQLPDEWYLTHRCSSGTRPWRGRAGKTR